ncbi:MAG: hypothetical protein LKI93_05035 [Bifidobacteriaceae bacterium]|jgi:predicted nucleic acid-binding protein|nr:hypothetical protein [Bifidobacteriaceae bacterium]MCI1914452.1 hypothetical protein [Bifidobacteriaceae bacterium]
MYKIFLDTNFLLDCANEERKRHQSAIELAGILQREAFQSAISPHSLMDFDYISRDISKELRTGFIQAFLSFYEVIPLTAELCSHALISEERDYEDGIIRACAESWEADYIVSADKSAYVDSIIPRVEAEDLLEKIKS